MSVKWGEEDYDADPEADSAKDMSAWESRSLWRDRDGRTMAEVKADAERGLFAVVMVLAIALSIAMYGAIFAAVAIGHALGMN